MAGFADIVREGVALASTLVEDLKVVVFLRRWKGNDEFGKPDYAETLEFKGIVNKQAKGLRTPQGQDLLVKARVVLLDKIEDSGITTVEREEPIDPNDIIILSDGTTGPILRVGGVFDPATNTPYAPVIWLG